MANQDNDLSTSNELPESGNLEGIEYLGPEMDPYWASNPPDEFAPITTFFNNHQSGRSTTKHILKYLDRNERGDAELFAEMFGKHIKYDHAAKKWYIWNEHYWVPDRTEIVCNGVPIVAETYKAAISGLKWGDKEMYEKLLLKRYNYLLTLRGTMNVLNIAKSLPSIRLTGDEWTVPSFYLPVTNGIVDLKAGQLIIGKPSDYINLFSPTKWLGLDHPAPQWEKFVSDICGEDIDQINFLQRLLGYAITGDTSEQIMAIFLGEGSNGKSILMDTVAKVLGSAFCVPTQAEILMETHYSNGEGARPFLVAMRNKRIVWASESQDGQRLKTGLVKQLTGDQNITARGLHRDPITFQPSHKIFLVTNSLPNLPDGNDYAMQRRLLVFPFSIRFVDDPTQPNQRKRDKDLLGNLLNESSGILAWLVRGTLAWQVNGLNPPEACKILTNEYQENADLLGQYVRNNLLPDDSFEVTAQEIFNDYINWCKENGYTSLSNRALGQRITSLYGKSETVTRGNKSRKVYKGIRLVPRQS